MKKIIILLSLLLTIAGCVKNTFPENPVLKSKIGSLIVNVSGEEYTAVPYVNEARELTDTLMLSVKIPSEKATVTALSLPCPGATLDVAVGDVITFVDDVCTLNYSDSECTKKYYLVMSYNPPPFLYLVKSSDRDEQRVRYYLDVNKNPHIVSRNYNETYEAFVDLTSTNWDNICLVKSDQTAYYDVAAGFTSNQTFGSLVLSEKEPQGDGHYPCEGPWGNWTTNAGNESIVSTGCWFIRFNMDSKELTMLETQWAISGTAVAGGQQMLTYDTEDKVWKLACHLSEGSFKFVTIPVNPSDPTLEYGVTSNGKLIEGGSQIQVLDGDMEIELNLNDAANLTYSVETPAEKVPATFTFSLPDGYTGESPVKVYQSRNKNGVERLTSIDLEDVVFTKDGTVTAKGLVIKEDNATFRALLGKEDEKSGVLKVEATQRPSNNGMDPLCDIMTTGNVTADISKEIAMTFNRVTTPVHLKLEGINGGEQVTSIEISAEDALAGTYDTSTKEYHGGDKSISLLYDKSSVAGAFDAYLSVLPGVHQALSIKVSTNKFEYTGTIEEELDFSAGKLVEISTEVINSAGPQTPIMYFVKTSDRFVDNKKYTVDPEQSQKVYSVNKDGQYEGYIDLTGTNWDNIGLVKSDLVGYFDSTSGFGGGQSYGTLTMTEQKREEGSVQYPCNGPWGDWTTTAGNEKIVSPGYWKVNFNANTKELTMLETQWAISGSAVSDVVAMHYDPETRLWKVECTLNAGNFNFVTIPVSASDPVVEYKDNVNVTGGNYEITLDLHSAAEHQYSVVQLSSGPTILYFVKTSDRFVENKKYTVDPEQSQKVYSVNNDGKYEGYIDLTGTSWDNIGLVKTDMLNYYDSSAGFGANQSYGQLTMKDRQKEDGSVQFLCDGPWGDWTTTAGNTNIISPGYWKLSFDENTKELTMLETQWAINGTALTEAMPMSYSPEDRKWKLSCYLESGEFNFETIPVSVGDPTIKLTKSVAVTEGEYEIVLDLHSSVEWQYSIKKTKDAPAYMYFVKTSDRFVENKKYTVDPEQSQRVYSVDNNGKYEGYIDLTGTSWDNIGLVKTDMLNYYDSGAGFGANQSYGQLTMKARQKEDGSVQFLCDGPWGDWTTTAGNDKIISPGIWKLNFDASTNELVMLETQWAVSGSAVSEVKSMTYNQIEKTWKVTCTMTEGEFKFVTIPVNAEDPTVEYGRVSSTSKELSSAGLSIPVQAGEYEIVLILNKAKHSYTINKK